MPGPLVADRWRRPVAGVAALGLIVLVVLAVLVYHGTTTPFDTWALRSFYAHIGPTGARTLDRLTEPVISIVLLAGTLVAAAISRRWDVAALAVVAPIVGVLLTEEILKPLIGRRIGPGIGTDDPLLTATLAFPSGHETFVACSAMVLFLACCQLPVNRAVRAVITVVLVLWTAGAAVGLVRNFVHYATDTIGAVGLSIAVVLGTALTIDAVVPRLSRRRAAGRRDRAPGQPATGYAPDPRPVS